MSSSHETMVQRLEKPPRVDGVPLISGVRLLLLLKGSKHLEWGSRAGIDEALMGMSYS